MKLYLVALCASAIALPGVASAQTAGSQTNASSSSSPATNQKAERSQKPAGAILKAGKLTQDLQKAGFTNVKVVAEAYVVQAKTKDGDPVVITLGPHGFSAVEAVNSNGSVGRTGDKNQQAIAVSRLKDMDLYNTNGDKLGDVEHVVSDGNGRDSIVLGKGGFLGLGEKQVMIPLSDVKMTGDRLVTSQITDEQIKTMPEWKEGQQTELDPSKQVEVRSAS